VYVADVDGRLPFRFHTARPTLVHTEDDHRQQAGGKDTDDWQERQTAGGHVIATLDERQVADDGTESESRHLYHTHTHTHTHTQRDTRVTTRRDME